jgi:nitrogenase molybdenum-iron cofactor biosynthesis protein NifN
MAILKESNKACSVYPLKLSQPLGAIYFLLGIKGCMPLMHGSQGCAAFAKTLLTRTFLENIPIQTTALSEIATVIGSDDNLHTAIENIVKKNDPDIVGIVSTGVSETRGDDVEGSIKRYKELYKDRAHKKFVFVSTPDYEGSLHDGYKKAMLSTVKTLVKGVYEKVPKQINLLLSYTFTAKDVDIIKETLNSFGLKPIVLPDVSSLDGSCKGFHSITTGGTDIKEIELMSASMATIAIGESTKEAGEYLEKKFMIPSFYFESIYGLKNFDRFIRLLMNLSGNEPDEKIKKWRDRLLDIITDSHFYLTGRKVAIAGEPDTLYGISDFLIREIGMEISIAVSSTQAENLKQLPLDEVIIGDLEDILLFNKEKVDIAIGNTNMRHIAKKLDIPHFRIGIPIVDKIGHHLKGFIGYEGCANFVSELANLLMEREEEISYLIPDYLKGSNIS